MKNNLFFDYERVIDLSHSYSSETIYWPTEDGFKLFKELEE